MKFNKLNVINGSPLRCIEVSTFRPYFDCNPYLVESLSPPQSYERLAVLLLVLGLLVAGL